MNDRHQRRMAKLEDLLAERKEQLDHHASGRRRLSAEVRRVTWKDNLSQANTTEENRSDEGCMLCICIRMCVCMDCFGYSRVGIVFLFMLLLLVQHDTTGTPAFQHSLRPHHHHHHFNTRFVCTSLPLSHTSIHSSMTRFFFALSSLSCPSFFSVSTSFPFPGS